MPVSSGSLFWLKSPNEGERFHAKFTISLIRVGRAGVTILGLANCPPFDPSLNYRLSFQFKETADRVSLHQVGLTIGGVISTPLLDNRTPVASPPLPDAVAPPIPVAAPASTRPRRLPKCQSGADERKKAIVIAWDIGHNPVGRAFLIADMLAQRYDVELIGPLFDRYGHDVWGPIRSAGIRYRYFRATNMADFLAGAQAMAVSS